MEPTVVLCTVPTQEIAWQIAQALVEERLAACVSLVPGLRSIYRWQGRICDDPEVLLLIKTRREKYPLLLRRLQETHPYEVPEVQAVAVVETAPSFRKWLEEAT